MNISERKSLIKINSDTAEAIARLYNVGPELSKRIVDYRNIHGYFKNPDDLIKVKGISLQLAITLSPHIDWQIPKQPAVHKERNIPFSVLWFLATVFNLWIIFYRRLPDIKYAIEIYQDGLKYMWTWIWIYSSLGLSSAIVALVAITAFIQAYTLNTKVQKAAFRISLFLGIGLILTLISVVLGNFVYYQFYSPNGWFPFINPVNISSALLAVTTVLVVLPLFLFTYVGSIRNYRKRFAELYDIGFAINGIALIAVSSSTSDIFPLGYRIFQIAIGVMYSYIGFQMIRYNTSMFDLVISYYQLDENRFDDSRVFWTSWINARLPNPEDQKELQKILNENHPHSKFKSFLGWLILGAGGWLIVTVISSLLDWVIQKGLNSFFP